MAVVIIGHDMRVVQERRWTSLVLRGCPKLDLAVALALALTLTLVLTLPLALALAQALAMNVQLWKSLKELRTFFNELWTSSGTKCKAAHALCINQHTS